MRNRGVSQIMPFLVIPRSLLRGGFIDLRGQRTLFKTIYTSHTVAWIHWFGDVITIRPELRFERSYATPAYDGGTKHNQFTAAMDAIFHY